jgi:hypothetical protein
MAYMRQLRCDHLRCQWDWTRAPPPPEHNRQRTWAPNHQQEIKECVAQPHQLSHTPLQSNILNVHHVIFHLELQYDKTRLCFWYQRDERRVKLRERERD